jgi:rod shape-determining protein MreC
MQQLIYFFQKYRYFLFFVLLEFIALFLIINNNTFHKSKFISSANGVTGGIYENFSNLSEYFNLKTRNEELALENEKLKNLIEKYNSTQDSTINGEIIDTLVYNQKYTYSKAKIIKNNYNTTNNFLTINRGVSQGVQKEMAVINSKGIIGITENSNSNYSRVQSILNSNSKINARLKNNTHFGSLEWDGKDYNIVQLHDVPRQAAIQVGDTIITGGKSTIFPEGILIGTIINIDTKNSKNLIEIQLFNDMSNLGHVYVITHLDKKEINSLNTPTNE